MSAQRHPAAAGQAAIRIIRDALLEVHPGYREKYAEDFARAVLARLGSHDPPLLICFPDEVKD